MRTAEPVPEGFLVHVDVLVPVSREDCGCVSFAVFNDETGRGRAFRFCDKHNAKAPRPVPPEGMYR